MKKGFIPVLFGIIVFGVAANSFAGSKKEDYELEEKCGKIAAEAFKKEYGNGVWTDNEGHHCISNYTNHYNGKLNKCFLVLSSTCPSKPTYHEKLLYDINENKEYGTLIQLGKTTMECDVRNIKCDSEKQWDDFIKSYMTE